MNDDLIQLLAVAILALTELHAAGHFTSPFAWFWDAIARIAGAISATFGRIALTARLHYFEAVGP